jgi:hypothetical protein
MMALVVRENRGGVRTGGGGGRPVVDVTSVSSCRLGFGFWRQKLFAHGGRRLHHRPQPLEVGPVRPWQVRPVVVAAYCSPSVVSLVAAHVGELVDVVV